MNAVVGTGITMQDRFRGTLLGLATGDALGGPVEFTTREAILTKYGKPLRDMVGGGWLKLKKGETTDDTAMARMLAESLIHCDGVDTADIARRYVAWMRSNPPDIGNITRAALNGAKAGLTVPNAALGAHRQLGGKSAGNGTIMRCAPVALRYVYDERRLIDSSRDEALVTHFDPLAWTGSIAVNLLISRLLHGMPLREAIKDVAYRVRREPKTAGEVAEVFEQARADVDGRLLPTSGFVLDTLRIALWALLGNSSLEEAVVAAVNQGGDADTQGAVTGAIAGARYGAGAIPGRWLDQLQERDLLQNLADQLLVAAEYRRVVV
jgi:ADP-ribosyl-[dinitrogen reductase] hydrolase